FSSRRRHTRFSRDWSSDVCSSDLGMVARSIRTNVLRFLDHTDDTKELAFDLSGLTTATTRTLTVPDASGTIALTSDLTPLGTKVDRKSVVYGKGDETDERDGRRRR